MKRSSTTFFFLWALCLGGGQLIAGALYTVALTGQQAPGLPAGVTFSQLLSGNSSNKPDVTSGGQIAYWGQLTGPGITTGVNNTGIWRRSESGSELAFWANTFFPTTSLIAEQDSLLSSNVTINSTVNTDVMMNSAGQIAFELLSGTNKELWVERGGSLTKIATSAVNAPGTSVIFQSYLQKHFGDDGSFLLLATVGTTPTTNTFRGIWLDPGSSLQLLVREGDPAPGTPVGVNFSGLNNSNPVLNNQGQVVFRSNLSGTNVTSSNNSGIWTNRSGSIAMIARQGNAAPGTPAGTIFGVLGTDTEHTAFNAVGHLAFRADLTGTGVTTANNNGIWTDRSGTLALYKRAGDAAPGTPAGVNFKTFRSPVLNDFDKLAFAAALSSNAGTDKDSGIWTDASGTLSALALEGSAAPGLAAGIVYGDFLNATDTIVLNNAGHIAFFGFLAGTGVTSSNDSGIWAQDRLGNLQLIVREGSQLEVAPGIFRTINGNALRFAGGSGNGDNMRSGFDDLGGVAFYASFTDGSSGIFYSTVAIPEPSTYFLATTIGLACLWRWKSRSKSMNLAA